MTKQSHGMSLIELMVTVVVVAILLSMGIPSFNNYLLNNQRQARASALIASASQARLTALRNGAAVVMCPGNGTSVTCGTDWSSGWQIVDPSSGTPTVISAISYSSSKVTIFTLNGSTQIQFNRNGLVTNSDSFVVCDSRGHTAAIAVSIGLSGYIQSSNQPGSMVDGSSISSSSSCP